MDYNIKNILTIFIRVNDGNENYYKNYFFVETD